MAAGMTERLYVQTWGKPTQPAVLFLHGFMGKGRDWTTHCERLADTHFCITVDLPGHGRSVKFSHKAYSMAGATAAVLHVLDDLTVSPSAWVGYSMGGRLALYMALHYPSRCQQLLLESASAGLPMAAERSLRCQHDEERARALEQGDFSVFLEAWYQQPLFTSLDRIPDLRGQMIAARLQNRPAELARSLREMGTGKQPSLWERLGGLRVSTCAVAGALDQKYVDLAQRMEAASPLLHAVVVPEAGHNVHAERPDAFFSILTNWLHP